MPQLSEVATIGASLVNPYASTPDSIESRAWMLWRAAVGTAQRTGAPTEYDHAGLMTTISLRKVAKDLFAGVPRDLAAVYANLKDQGNARCVERGGRGDTPIWWFRREFNADEPTAEVTQLPVEAPELPATKVATVPKKRVMKNTTGMSMTQADQRAAILKALAKAEHPVYVEELAKATKLHRTTVRVRAAELIADERAFRRLETLDERDGTPGRRHFLYWGSPDIPMRPAELFFVTKPGSNPGNHQAKRRSVLERVEGLTPGHAVSLTNATKANLAAVQDLLDAGVIEYVNTETKREVRLKDKGAVRAMENGPKPGSKLAEASTVATGVVGLGERLEAGLNSLIKAEVDRRLAVQVANEVSELERRLSESEAMRVTAQTELSALKDRVKNLLG